MNTIEQYNPKLKLEQLILRFSEDSIVTDFVYAFIMDFMVAECSSDCDKCINNKKSECLTLTGKAIELANKGKLGIKNTVQFIDKWNTFIEKWEVYEKSV
jgi:hypothetical protein